MLLTSSIILGAALSVRAAATGPNRLNTRQQARPVYPPANELSFVIAPPAADGGASANWQRGFEAARDIVSQMTVEERVRLHRRDVKALQPGDGRRLLSTGHVGDRPVRPLHW